MRKIIRQTFSNLKQSKKYFVCSILSDFLFLVLLAMIHYFLFLPTLVLSQKLLELINQEFSKLMASKELVGLNSALMQNPDFVFAFNALIKMLFLFLLLFFLAWILVKCLAWYFTHKMVYPKIPLGKYFGKFFTISLMWFGVILLFIFGSSFFLNSQDAMSNAGTITTIMWILLIVLGFFIFAGYALIPAERTFKKMFTLPIKNFKRMFMSYVISITCLIIALGLPIYFGKYYPIFGLLTLLFLGLPLLAFGRLNIIVASWRKK